MTSIEWTHKTWNPLVGCSLASPGCTNCYAMKMAARLEAMAIADRPRWTKAHRNGQMLTHYVGTTQRSKAGPVWTGKVSLAPDHIVNEPFRRKKPTTYFVNSMSDLFHEDVPDDWIDRVFAIMALCPQHTFQVLTKRSARMRAYMTAASKGKSAREGTAEQRCKEAHHWGRHDNDPGWKGWPLPNVWLGVSCEDQKRADERIPDLLATPAAIRFVSAEPLLGPLDLTQYLSPVEEHGIDFSREPGSIVGGAVSCRPALDWVIVGGESGPGARPMHPDWPRSLRDQCLADYVAFFFKQWGEHEAIVSAADMQDHMRHGGDDEDLRDARRKSQVVWPDGQRLTPEPLFEWWANLDLSSEDGDESSMTGCPVVMRAVGKKTAGRLLDGREWNEFPGVGAASTPERTPEPSPQPRHREAT